MKRLFIHSPLFRIVCPLVYGVVVYLLVLLVFDSISQLTENFFSQEVLLCILLTYLLSESLRLMIILLDTYYPLEKNVRARIVLQVIVNLLCTIAVISGGVAIYFIYILGYTTFSTELLTFNSTYMLTSLFYTMLYLSVYYLNRHNKTTLQKERALRQRMESQLQQLTKEVNPELLYNSLETLIVLAHQDACQAEQFIDRLSLVYRYFLDHKLKELTALQHEVEAASHLVFVYNKRYNDAIRFHVNLTAEEASLLMIPGTLLELIENAILTTIISQQNPLEIDAYTESDYFVVTYQRRDRLMPRRYQSLSIKEMAQAYTFFTDRPLLCQSTEEECVVKVPLLQTQPDQSVISAKKANLLVI
jgi:two-component system, LytTR family, sensor kinase